MFVIVGIVALVVFSFLRPQDVFDPAYFPTFPQLLGVVAIGYLLDFRLGKNQPRATLLLGPGLAFYVWELVTVAVNAPSKLAEDAVYFAGPTALFLAASQGIPNLRSYWTTSKALLVVSVCLAGMAVYQGLQPKICIDEALPGLLPRDAETSYRPCTGRGDCYEGVTDGREFFCERPGVLGTFSISDRVRYLGVFQDPNNLAWVMSMYLPFALSWFGAAPSRRRLLVFLAILALCITCNIMTKSRSGQISLIATFGVYFIRRFGWKGAVIGGVLGLPVMLLGGREGGESSTEERLQAWSESFDLWREYPVMGVGAHQFNEHTYMTAHNSYMLALADMGPVGLFLWTLCIYLAFKLAIRVQSDFAHRPEAAAARSAAFAMLAGLVGTVASAVFLSLTYHVALWMQLGLAGALQSVVWQHDPEWRVRCGWKDLSFVAALDVALVAGTLVYLRVKGF